MFQQKPDGFEGFHIRTGTNQISYHVVFYRIDHLPHLLTLRAPSGFETVSIERETPTPRGDSSCQNPRRKSLATSRYHPLSPEGYPRTTWGRQGILSALENPKLYADSPWRLAKWTSNRRSVVLVLDRVEENEEEDENPSKHARKSFRMKRSPAFPKKPGFCAAIMFEDM